MAYGDNAQRTCNRQKKRDIVIIGADNHQTFGIILREIHESDLISQLKNP